MFLWYNIITKESLPWLLPKGSSNSAKINVFSNTKYRNLDTAWDLHSMLSVAIELQCLINVISSNKQDRLSAPQMDGKYPTYNS